jgi:hypothetical protein
MQKVCHKISPYLLRRKVLLLFLLWFLFNNGICQDSTYLVKPGIHPVKVIPLTERYQYPGFRIGFLYFSTGKKSDEFLLNYNLFAQQIQLIDSRGDTVALDNKLSIVEFIQIESDFYFRDLKEGYFLLLTNEEPLKLTKRTTWNEMVFPNGESTFQKIHEFFFLAPSPNRVLRAYKSSLTKIFPNNRQAIKEYLSQHNIDFTKESDLKQIIAYCNGLADREDR